MLRNTSLYLDPLNTRLKFKSFFYGILGEILMLKNVDEKSNLCFS